jgi:hypothetical protein
MDRARSSSPVAQPATACAHWHPSMFFVRCDGSPMQHRHRASSDGLPRLHPPGSCWLDVIAQVCQGGNDRSVPLASPTSRFLHSRCCGQWQMEGAVGSALLAATPADVTWARLFLPCHTHTLFSHLHPAILPWNECLTHRRLTDALYEATGVVSTCRCLKRMKRVCLLCGRFGPRSMECHEPSVSHP